MFGLFGRSSEMEEQSDENECEKASSPEMVTVEETEIHSKSYTEHEAVAHFANGDEVPFTFDAMKRQNDGSIVLKNYVGLYQSRGKWRFREEAFATLFPENLNYFETEEREEKEIFEETTNRQAVTREVAERHVEGNGDAHIVEDNQE